MTPTNGPGTTEQASDEQGTPDKQPYTMMQAIVDGPVIVPRAPLKLLKRDEILSVSDIQRELVPVPEWNGAVWVKALTGGERDAFEASCLKTTGNKATFSMLDVRAKLCVRCIIAEDGTRMFSDDDYAELTRKSSSAIARIFDVASRLSKISEADVEELAGNSEKGQPPVS